MNTTEPMLAFLSNGGAAGTRVHAHDWSAHPLGPIAGWPPALRTDIGLPDIDGYALARRLQDGAGARRARYLALTGYGQVHDRVLARAAGFDHHFVKPVDLGALTQVIDNIPPAPGIPY